MVAMESQGQRIKKFLVSLDEVEVGRDLWSALPEFADTSTALGSKDEQK